MSKDKLTQYGNESITYDAGGNPLSYRGFTFTWEKGRQLKGAVRDGDTYAYTYNAAGIRTTKTMNNIEHRYTLEGTRIIEEKYDNHSIKPLYNNEDTICGIEYDGSPYYFFKNLQGDIVAIVDDMSNVVARYHYDGWGACTTDSDTSGVGIASINPYRYRGYYFDTETGFYYLQSRYYDPAVGRFINADEILLFEKINDNLYAYCTNNPISLIDHKGYCEEGNAFTYEAIDLTQWFEFTGTFDYFVAGQYIIMLNYIKDQSSLGRLEATLIDLAVTVASDVAVSALCTALGISLSIAGSVALTIISGAAWAFTTYTRDLFEADLEKLADAIATHREKYRALNIYFLFSGSPAVKICEAHNNKTIEIIPLAAGHIHELALAAAFYKDLNDPKSNEDKRPSVGAVIVGRNVPFNYYYK